MGQNETSKSKLRFIWRKGLTVDGRKVDGGKKGVRGEMKGR